MFCLGPKRLAFLFRLFSLGKCWCLVVTLVASENNPKIVKEPKTSPVYIFNRRYEPNALSLMNITLTGFTSHVKRRIYVLYNQFYWL